MVVYGKDCGKCEKKKWVLEGWLYVDVGCMQVY